MLNCWVLCRSVPQNNCRPVYPVSYQSWQKCWLTHIRRYRKPDNKLSGRSVVLLRTRKSKVSFCRSNYLFFFDCSILHGWQKGRRKQRELYSFWDLKIYSIYRGFRVLKILIIKGLINGDFDFDRIFIERNSIKRMIRIRARFE